MGIIRSYFKALKASRYLGAALKYDKKDDFDNALEKARDGLNILTSSKVIRENPAESSLLISLTILVEQVSNKLHCDGACEKDLVDTYLSLKELEGTQIYNEHIDWLHYLEDKLGYMPSKS